MATQPQVKTVIPLGIKAKDIQIIQDAISKTKKDSKCYLQTSDGILFEMAGTITFKRVAKI